MGKVTARRRVLGLDGRDGYVQQVATFETLVVEEPLEIRVSGVRVEVAMRTPGHDVELAHGWLHSAGWITGRADVRTARFCEGVRSDRDPDADTASYNTINITLEAERARLVALDPDLGRGPGAASEGSCGVGGARAIDQLMRHGRFDVSGDPAAVAASAVWAAVSELQRRRPIAERTGCAHAAALFDHHGRLLVAREDVDQLNAVDEVIGWAVLDGRLDDRRPLAGHMLVVDAPARLELVRRAHLAGVPVVVTMAAATSLAAQAAEQTGITLVSCAPAALKAPAQQTSAQCPPDPATAGPASAGTRLTLHAHPHRVVAPAQSTAQEAR